MKFHILKGQGDFFPSGPVDLGLSRLGRWSGRARSTVHHLWVSIGPTTMALCGCAAIFLCSAGNARAADVSVIFSATYVGDEFLLSYGLGSPSPNKTVYLYVNGSEVDSATDTSSAYCWYTPASSGDYTFDVYYSDSVNGPTSPTYNNTAGTYHVDDPPSPSVSSGSASGTVGIAFSYYIDGGGYVSSYDASNLPPGLNVNTSTGQIYGTPTTVGTYNTSIYAYNDSGSSSGTLAVTISAQVAPTITSQPCGDSPASTFRAANGWYHTVLLRQDGKVWAVGSDGNGQLGDGFTNNESTAVVPLGLANVVAIAGGYAHTIAVTSAGNVFGFGRNDFGQLGDGTTVERHQPVQLGNLSGATQVAAGYYHTVVVKSDGTVWSSGYNGYGQLGDGTSTNRSTVVQMSGMSGATAAAASYYTTLILKSDGTVWACGYNGYGQLGDGTSTTRYTAVQVPGLTGIVSIAAGGYSSFAVKSDGTVWAWGYNGYGQLGDNTATSRYAPVQLNTISGVTAIAAAYDHTIFLKSNGTVWACGYNGYGELGDGTTNQHYSPVQVNGIAGAVAVAAGYDHNTIVKSDGTVWSSGYNGFGQLGDGTTSTRYTPVQAVRLGDSVFSVGAYGNPAPTYQWQREPAGQSSFSNLSNNATYSGATTPTLRIGSPTAAMNGDKFRCVITNLSGSVTSNEAPLILGVPTVSAVGGNNQAAQPSSFNANPFDVAVWNAAASAPLMGASVTFTVQSGGGMLATSNAGSPPLSTSITLTTDVDGTAQVFYKQPSASGVTSQIVASSGGGAATFTSTSVIPGTPPSAPAWLHAATSTPTSVSFLWGPSTPYNGATIIGYDIYRNGVLISGPQIGMAYSDASVTAGTTYTYTVEAIDSTGGTSAAASLTTTAPSSSTSGTFEVYTPTL